MKRIGIPIQNNTSVSFYRAYSVIVELRKAGHIVDMFHPNDRTGYAKCDWIFSHMLFGKGAEKVVEMAQQMECKIWIDVDDNIFNVPFSNISFEHHVDRRRQRYILDKADMVTVSTKPLKSLIENFLMKNNILLLENYLCINGIEDPRTDGRRVVAWRGGASHSEDFPDIIDELYKIQEVCDELHFFGERPSGFTPNTHCQVMWHKFTDMWTYMDTLKKVNPSVLFSYWADIPFNTCKSDIVWQEATAAGAVLVMNTGWDAFEDMNEKDMWCYTKADELAKVVGIALDNDNKNAKRFWVNSKYILVNLWRHRYNEFLDVNAVLTGRSRPRQITHYMATNEPSTGKNELNREVIETLTEHDGDEAHDRYQEDGI